MQTELLSYINSLVEKEKQLDRSWSDDKKRMASLQQYADSQFKKAHNQTLFCAREPIDVRLIKHLDGEQAIYIDHKLVIIPEQPAMPHRHAYIEFACILEGECDQMIEGESVHLCAGDAIIVDQNCQHMEAYTGKTLCIVWLGLRREFLIDEVLPWLEGNGGLCSFIRSESQGNEKLGKYLVMKPGVLKDKIFDYLLQIIKEDAGLEACYDKMLELLTIRLLREMHETYQYRDAHNRELQEQRVFFSLDRYIRDHLDTVSVASLQTAFHYNRNYYNKVIMRRNGETCTEYIRRLRLEKASELLRKTDRGIDEIMADIGISSRSYFYKIFKAFYGVSPDQYRRGAAS